MTKLFYTPTEVADVLRVTSRTLSNKRALGNGPAFFIDGGVIRYPIDALEDYINQHMHHNSKLARKA